MFVARAAMSKVIQKLIPHMDTLENLLDILISNCGMEKAFLIDVISKVSERRTHTQTHKTNRANVCLFS